MAKHVFLNEKQQIELLFEENLNEDELKVMLKTATKLIAEVKEKKLPVYLLADVNKLNKLTIAARRYGSSRLLKQPVDKIAVYGDNLFMKYFVRMLSGGLGLNDKMSFFSSRKEAEQWL